MSRILLINSPNRTSEPPRHYPYGIAILANILVKGWHQVSIFDGNFSSLEELSDILGRNQYGFIGISGLITTFPFQRSVAKMARNYGKGAIIASGGGLASSIGDELLDLIPEVDIVFVGEAEISLPSFLSGVEERSQCSTDSRRVVIGQIEKEIDKIPFPDLSHFDLKRYFLQGSFPLTPSVAAAKKRANILTSRGCPFNCDFCFSSLGRQSIRYRSVENVLEEIEELITRYKIDFVSFLDESFLTNKARILTLAEGMKKRGMNLKWGMAARSTSVDKEILVSIAEAGCDFIYYGFDSGSPETLKMMNKYMSIEENIDAFMLTIEAGIIPVPNIIIGYDNETMKNIEENYIFLDNLIRRGKALAGSAAREIFTLGFNNFGAIYFATPYPGSQLYLRNRYRLPPLLEILERISGKDAYELTVNVSSISDDRLRIEQKKMESFVRGFKL